MMKTSITPQFFRRSSKRDRQTITALQAAGLITKHHDVLRSQMLQFAAMRAPAQHTANVPRSMRAHLLDNVLAGRSMDEYAVEVFLPWLGLLIRMLPRDDFNALRCARNRTKITMDEQRHLQQLTIGVAGMSSGGAIARVLALGGLCGRLRLADFDHLETSNLNRLQAGVHELGLNKAVLCAQRILENNPYQDVSVFTSGIHLDNTAAFIDKEGRLDILIEQVDDLPMKIALRRQARRQGVIVIMETNDRGILDIERFDHEPTRPLLHGLVNPQEIAEGMDDAQRMRAILNILEGCPTPRLADSFRQLGTEVSGWPQLASEVTLGAATVAHAVMRIGTRKKMPSGRYTVDLDRVLASSWRLQHAA